MPNTSEQNNKFKYESNYNKATNFSHVRFGHDLPILETELNEMQIIPEKRLSSILSHMLPSGFIEKNKREFNGESIVYNPIYNGRDLTMQIAIAPFRAMIAGKEVNGEGNFLYNELNNYVLIDLGDSPVSGVREDLVYLEVWYEVVGEDDNVYKYGYQNGVLTNRSMIDARIQKETSRRVMLCWNIRVAKNINFNNFPDGFGYKNVNSYSPIYALANGQLPEYNTNYIFSSANSEFFQGEEFYGDGNLYVAGRPNYEPSSTSLYNKYIFALPMFRVKRRNKSAFTLVNFNGTSIIGTDIRNSSINGDINGNIRPDKLTYDYIVDKDIIDIRTTINFDHLSDYYRDDAFIKLISGDLQTKDKEKIRRVQFGTTYKDYKENANLLLYCEFDKEITPFSHDSILNNYGFSGDNPVYGDSAFGSGVILNGKTSFYYKVNNLTNSHATFDFFMQPNWNSGDSENVISILKLVDVNNNALFELKKEGHLVSFYQYYNAAQTSGTTNVTSINLSKILILENNLYHIRLSYNVSDVMSGIYMYLNGNLCAQGLYSSSQLTPSKIILGKEENTGGEQLIISDFAVYNIAFEQNQSGPTGYYVSNTFWDMLPPDVISSDALLLPSFNSDLLSFSDNPTKQKLITMLNAISVDGTNIFILSVPDSCIVDSEIIPIVYNTDGIIINGQWSSLGTNKATFTISNTSVMNIIVVYNMVVSKGHGGSDVPDDVLFAGFIKDNELIEISYHRKNSNTPRQVSYYKPRKISGNSDTAFDFSLSGRSNKHAFARLLNYYVNGNSTNQYVLSMNLYGYNIFYVKEVVGKRIKRCSRIPATDNNSNGTFIIELTDIVYPTETLHFVLAMEGCCFDFESNSKTLIENLHTTKMVSFVADGLKDTYTIPCFDSDNINGGILKSVGTFMVNTIDAYGEINSSTEKCIYYLNNEMYYAEPIYDDNGVYTGQSNHLLAHYTINENSFGTPFLTLTFAIRPQSGSVINIPVLVSYQPTKFDAISMWYKYTPYQGILSNETVDVKRVSEWKFFITTLGSGNNSLSLDNDIIHSLSNVVNRLPGGLGNSHLMDGSNINLNCFGEMSERNDIHKQFICYDSPFFGSHDGIFDHSKFKFLTDFSIFKTRNNFQDGVINLNGQNFKLYFPDCKDSIYKYTGMYCTVIDNKGRMLLFVIGCINDQISSPIVKLEPNFADLFFLEDRPTIIMRG